MLILTRKTNQSIMLGDDIEIVITEIKGDSVKIGIVASRDLPIYRKELYLEIKQENLNALNNNDILLKEILSKKIKNKK